MSRRLPCVRPDTLSPPTRSFCPSLAPNPIVIHSLRLALLMPFMSPQATRRRGDHDGMDDGQPQGSSGSGMVGSSLGDIDHTFSIGAEPGRPGARSGIPG